MEFLSSTAQIAWAVLLVILGLNALIIVHEFGHFIVARWCGVRCDKFYIWFDLFGYRLCRFRWGDTEYGIGWAPLGGYVKMFGQEDNPGEARAEIERAKLAATQAEEALEHGDQAPAEAPSVEQVAQLEKAMYSPDSYLAKSIPQRMAIISAGVIMNFIFAFLCAAVAYMIGVTTPSSLIGGTTPGSPAWTAGIRAGDRMLEVNGKPTKIFEDVRSRLLENGSVDLLIERDGAPGRPVEFKGISGRKKSNDLLATIGVTSGFTTELNPFDEFAKDFKDEEKAAVLRKILPQAFWDTLALYPNGCEVVAVDGKPVDSCADIVAWFDSLSPEPLMTLTLDDTNLLQKQGKGQGKEKAPVGPKTVEIPRRPMRELPGLKLAMGPITAVVGGGDAQEQRIGPGDTVLKLNGQDVDPLRLPFAAREFAYHHAGSEETTQNTILVRKKDGSQREYGNSFLAATDESTPNAPQDEIASGQLGIAYGIAGVLKDDGSVARVESVEFLGLEKPKKMPFAGLSFCTVDEKSVKYTDIGTKVDLPVLLLGVLQSPALPEGVQVRIKCEGEKGEGTVYTSRTATDWFAVDRDFVGLIFKPETVFTRASFGEACALGLRKTVDSTLLVFTVLKKLITGQISPKGMGGPVLIVKVAYSVSQNGFTEYLIFLCLIGANLAVMNILPIPVLDGGHLVFLAYEGATGRQPNPVLFEILCWIGLALILVLMVWVCLLDFDLVHRM